ncbi:MAG TPA: helix-turn-helix transcriptional regulator [Mycobacterium sp.]|jgi:transcriptional regulator with XRE-family HTH domain|uniref:helix-turn-helix domain-containing protein n=1 Tax=Mycobacterium sp. TaxID=1785 RepID=UPI002F4161C9
MANGQTGGRDALSQSLRDAQAAAGLSGKETAAKTGLLASKVSRLLAGKQVPTEADVVALAEAFNVPAAERRRILSMARDVKAENKRVVAYRDPAAIQARIGRVERNSALIREFSPNIIPGLLQSPGYARTLMESAGWGAEDTERAIAGRLERQLLLDKDTEPRRWLILLTEGALGWALGPPAVMLEQIDRISVATYRVNARVGIVPFGQPAKVAPLHSWDLYDERFVVVGTLTNTAFLEEARDIRQYVELTNELEALAKYGPEAREILTKVADRYRSL